MAKLFSGGVGRKFVSTALTAVALLAALPMLKWVMGGVVPPAVVQTWLVSFVANAAQFGVSNAVSHIAERGAKVE